MRLATHTLRSALPAASSLLLLAALVGASASPMAQTSSIALPVTFEESIDYELTDFAGPTSTLVADPTDASNTVVQTVRPPTNPPTVECYAGTTVAETSGFTERIPFTADETTMSVRVWSPQAGIRVLFKVEEVGVGTVNVETYSFTTVADAWETIVFDFADPKPNTNPISVGANYNKASIFFDFQCGLDGATPATRTYYWDDVAFGSGGDAGTPPLVINEVDADQAGTDAAEFVELYNDGSTPIDLADYVIVLVNGNGEVAYGAHDLDGFTLAAGDYFVFCGDAANVANCDLEIGTGTTNLIQNGADAVALYLGDAASFSNGTAATTANLVDALVYGTNDADDADLLAALGQTVQYNDTSDESMQRSPDGDATVINAAPTPGEANAILTDPETFTALLRGENEATPVDTDAKGGATATLDGTTLTVSGTFAGLTGTYAAAHVHGGPVGENGPVVLTLTATTTADLYGGSFDPAANTFEVRPTFADSIRAGLAYVNVHSSAHGGGEIRGQLGTEVDTLPFALSGANERPTPVTTPATGSGTVSLDGSTATLTGSFSGLTGDYLFSHIHAGAADASGGVVVTLTAALDTDNRGGTYEAASNTFELRPTFADSVRAGLAYVNVHSATFNGGEIRGQIGVAPEMTSTFAEARAAGSGATVTVEGTVTRAMGAFTYFQDETGGLTIRQPSGAFFDAVAAGTIAPGTTLRVTGTLSEFRSLLQINEGGLAAYEITGTAAVPAAQVVTLAQIAAAGEAYEAELVTVQDVTIAANGDTDFAASRTYQITDASDASNGVSLRVPSANDSSVDGTAIPVRANITAVVGQFSSSDPAVGYQLLVIAAADVETLQGVATEGEGEAALSLSAANPVSQNATVRFSLDAPGRARVALYDALGRQVAVVAEGEMVTGPQTARLDTGALAAGVYVLRLETETGALAQTLTVVR